MTDKSCSINNNNLVLPKDLNVARLMQDLKLERYPEYKDSGVEWLGEIPVGWEQIKCKFITDIYTGSSISDDIKDNFVSDNSKLTPYISTKDIDLNTLLINYNNGMRIDQQLNHDFKLATKDSILLCIEGGSAGKKISFVEQNIYFVNKLACFKIKHYYSKYYFYYLQSSAFLNQFYILLNGLIGGVAISNIKQIIAIVPPLAEQQQIADFLDKKISHINQAIAQKEKMIELLKEYRQVTINNAVTKGLDHNVELKPSEVDWLGDIPVGWEVKRLKFLFEIVKTLYSYEDKPVLSITQDGLKVKDLKNNDGQHAKTYIGYQIVKVNDFAMNPMDLLTGYIDCAQIEGVTSPDYRVFRFRKAQVQSYDYYKYLFQMCYVNKIFYGFGQGVSNLGRWRLQRPMFLNLLIPIPPLAEQQCIADFLDKKTAQINESIKLQQQQIQKLKEYKATLINSAVTGKIRV